jgi:hypothetical protein
MSVCSPNVNDWLPRVLVRWCSVRVSTIDSMDVLRHTVIEPKTEEVVDLLSVGG